MNLFVYSEVTPSQKEYLLSRLPKDIKPWFANELTGEQKVKQFQEADLLLGNPPPDWFIQELPHLSFWQIDSAGFDQYVHTKVNAVAVNMGNYYSLACAETMVAGLLAFYRGLPTLVRLQTQLKWMGKELRPSLELLSNKKIIILGAGTIATALKTLLSGFSCRVKLTARKNPLADIFTQEDLFANLPETDVVVNTLPGHLNKMVSDAFINKMKPGSVYASVGRGNTTDEDALIYALNSGHLAGAVLDVTLQEPLPSNSPLWQMEQVLLTQHTGGGQKFEVEGKIDRLLNNLDLFLSGQEIPDQVNLAQGY